MNVLVFTSLWPNGEQPNFGVFVKHRALAVARLEGVRTRVVAPVPYFPKALAGAFVPEDWRTRARVKGRETIEGLPVEHPRYLVTPKVGMRFYGRWMARGAEAVVRRLHAEEPFDLIDAHYAFPDGHAAFKLARALDLPILVTARGSDINQFSRLPYIRPLLKETLAGATHVITVSGSLRDKIIALGISPDRVTTIRNGINRGLFTPRDRVAAREKLGLDPSARIVVTVGHLNAVKGIDRLIDAMGLIKKQAGDAGVRLYAIGEGRERPRLEKQIADHGLTGRVFLPGARPQAELPEWYSAADLFCLASHREGCPNVVIEALACGVPVVATDVDGIGELITSPAYGRLVVPGDNAAGGFAEKIAEAWQVNWDRQAIAAYGRSRAWEDVAAEVKEVMNRAVRQHREKNGSR
ncbi:MAG TPA: glycosyltransferase family 4 protein [Blastocatellia bacterium]|nr:glycosyltransferase family 4 protein [Blastocatellia bacterium]